MTSKAIRRHRRYLFEKNGGRCCYCDGKTWMLGRQKRTVLATMCGVKFGTPGSAKIIAYAMATFEHVKRRADGGTNGRTNGFLSCAFCNHARDASDPDVHRMDMQALVDAGVHPVNRKHPVADARRLRRLALKAIAAVRAGKPIDRGDSTP